MRKTYTNNSKAQAQKNVDAFKGVVKGIKSGVQNIKDKVKSKMSSTTKLPSNVKMKK